MKTTIFDSIVLTTVFSILLISSTAISSNLFQNNDTQAALLHHDTDLEKKKMHQTFALLADDVCDDCDDDDPSLNEKPTAYIYEVTPNPGNEFQSISFLGYGDDPDGEIIGYLWESDIDHILNTNASFTTSALSPATHTIYFAVQDDDGTWSSPVNITLVIIENQPPLPPVIGGKTQGKAGEPQQYNFITTDPNDNAVYYFIKWGDSSDSDWIGPHESNEEISLTHTYEKRGTYTIQAKAKDAHDEESEWSTLKVSAPKTSNIKHMLMHLLQNHPHLLPFFTEMIKNSY